MIGCVDGEGLVLGDVEKNINFFPSHFPLVLELKTFVFVILYFCMF